MIIKFLINKLCNKLRICLLLIYCLGYSQIGINTESPDPSTILDIRTKDNVTPGGVSLPSVQLQRATSIVPFRVTPKEGLLLYNPTDVGTVGSLDFVPKGFNYWDGAGWTSFLQNNWLRPRTITPPRINEDQYAMGHIGIGEKFSTQPINARLHIQGETGKDPLIIEGVRLTDGVPSDTYYDMVITENGAVRKSLSQPSPPSTSSVQLIDLAQNILPEVGDDMGVGGSFLTWTINNVPTQDIILPEDGSYVFYFRLYCEATPSRSQAAINYISLWKSSGSSSNYTMQDVVTLASPPIASLEPPLYKLPYSIDFIVKGNKGDKVKVKISRISSNTALNLEFKANNQITSSKTSLLIIKK